MRQGLRLAASAWPREGPSSPLAELRRAEAAVLAAGLGASTSVGAVRWLVPELVRLVGSLSEESPAPAPRRVPALLPLAEAAAAGLFAFAVSDPGEPRLLP